MLPVPPPVFLPARKRWGAAVAVLGLHLGLAGLLWNKSVHIVPENRPVTVRLLDASSSGTPTHSISPRARPEREAAATPYRSAHPTRPAPLPAAISDPKQAVELPPETTQTLLTDAAVASEAVAAEPSGNMPDEAAQASTVTAGWPVPAALTWEYEVEGRAKGLNYRAQATLSWLSESDRYLAEMSVQAFLLGRRSQRSEGVWSIDGLAPQQFTDQAKRTRQWTFDATQQRWTVNGVEQPDALPAGTQDRLSLFVQLAQRLGQEGPPVPGTRWSVPVASAQGIESWVFVWQGPEHQKLPLGTVATWHLQREPRRVGDLGVDLWLAAAWPHLPVRIRLTHSEDEVIDQRLRHTSPDWHRPGLE